MRTLSTVLSCLALSACGGLHLQAAAPVGEPLVAGVETSQEPRDGLFRVEEKVGCLLEISRSKLRIDPGDQWTVRLQFPPPRARL